MQQKSALKTSIILPKKYEKTAFFHENFLQNWVVLSNITSEDPTEIDL